MAHKKAGGSTALGRDSQSQRLGVKLYAGEYAKPGSIIIRQRGSKFKAGLNTRQGKDDTIFSTALGIVKFARRKLKKFDGHLRASNIVNVIPQEK